MQSAVFAGVMLRIASLCAVVAVASASFCGDSAIPFSFEALPDGQPVLGCARPSCFGWLPTGQPASANGNFYRIHKRPDGFFRKDRETVAPFSARDPRYYQQKTATCEQTFQSTACSAEDQWVGGIAPLTNVSGLPTVLQCCKYEPLRLSTDRGVAVVGQGQIVVGGEVLNNGRQYAFDYISDIVKNVNADGSVSYDISVRRFPCLPAAEDTVVDPAATEQMVRQFEGDAKAGELRRAPENARAFQAPTVQVERALEGPFTEENVVEETVQQQAVQLGQEQQQQQQLVPQQQQQIVQQQQLVQQQQQFQQAPRVQFQQPQGPPQQFQQVQQVQTFQQQPTFFRPQQSYAQQPQQGYQAQNNYAQQPQQSAYPVPPAYNSYVRPPVYPPAAPVYQPIAPAYQPVAAAPAYYAPAAAPAYYGGGGGGYYYCFTADTKVNTVGGVEKRMDELTTDDWIQTLNGTDVVYSPLTFWLHRVPTQEAEFHKIALADGTELKITAHHYIYKTECPAVDGEVDPAEMSREAVFAEQVEEGDCLYRVEGTKVTTSKVVAVEKVTETGIYAPMTGNGKLVVNGVYASCHNILQSHTLQNSFFSYVDYFNNLYASVFGGETSEVRELPLGMDTIVNMLELVVPKNLITM